MSLVNLNNMLFEAFKGGYAVGAFNVYNIEDITAVVNAAEEAKSPVILMTSSSAIVHSGMEELASIIKCRANNTTVPICLHLDHATDYKKIIKAMYIGYSSVMYDGSLLSYEKNVNNTKEIVKVAHSLNVTVEAEIGRVGNSEEGNKELHMVLSKPDEVKSFVEETGIDACAIAIGSSHGMQKQKANLNFKLLDRIRNEVDLPLVLHGSSGVIEAELTEAGRRGIQKVNIGTRLKRVFSDMLKKNVAGNKEIHNHVKLLRPSINAVKDEVMHKMKILGCINKI